MTDLLVFPLVDPSREEDLPPPRSKRKRSKISLVRLQAMTLREGMDYLLAPTQERKIDGFWVENKNASTRLRMFRDGHTNCLVCGISGVVWYIERHRNDKIMPFSINLYGKDSKGEEILMTWDHLLPRSLGGSNHIQNAQCLCTRCNGRKGNNLTMHELIIIASHKHPNLIHKLPNPETRSLFETLHLAALEYRNLTP